ncbi:H+/gluconate symporter [Singulisphaera sp. GP187]|uniref:GntP family permease n=1 Tax=Singulisphaera sp. GP187 TaxID=1882752 RepID=UPI00092A0A6D|nr:GntP family permease [Singulisphaera sp. GP187]SIO22806.1 H+/gluconate symporter [Singulisphaera sp. GP187]
MNLEVLAIVVSLALLMVLAYRGFPVIIFAPICALLAVGLSGRALLPSYTETFMTAATGYIRSFFPLFLMGAIFGKLMETNGSAAAIAGSIAGLLGARRAILAVVLACAVLTYGGVSLFVVAFAVYPFASALFREADIPKRLIPGAIALGAFTLTMDALPGSPQIQNLIPTRFFGTDTYAGPVVGIIGGVLVLLGGLFWLDRRRAMAAAAGEGYGTGHRNEPEVGSNEGRPPLFVALIPLGLVLGANFVLSRTAWSVANWYPDAVLHRDFPAVNVAASAPTWALIVALALGITAALAINPKRWKDRFSGTLTAATSGALLAIFNTASEVGFGNVVKTLPGFFVIRDSVFLVSRHVLVAEAVAVNVLAGITGSASGGLSIALEVMGARYLELARAQGISPELLHRIASMASGGMDTLPHNGAVITLLAITGLTHRQSYPDIFAITILKTVTVFAMAFGVSAFHGG